GRGLSGDGGRGVRAAEPGGVRDALRGLRGGPRALVEGPERAAAAAGDLAGDGALLPWPGAGTARIQEGSRGSVSRGRRCQGRDPLRQRRARGGAPGRPARGNIADGYRHGAARVGEEG